MKASIQIYSQTFKSMQEKMKSWMEEDFLEDCQHQFIWHFCKKDYLSEQIIRQL